MRLLTSVALAMLAVSVIAAPGHADPNAGGLDLSSVPDPLPRADSGKPAIRTDSSAPSTRCLPTLPCDARLIGTVRKNGAVELQVPAWHW